MSITRRQILQSGVAAAVGLALDGNASAQTGSRGTNRMIQTTVTAADGRRMAKGEPLAWGTTTNADVKTITVDPLELRHPILGFGAAFTEASCFLLDQMPAAARDELLAEWLGPNAAGFSIARLCIGASDYSTTVYSYDEGTEPDLELARFSIDQDRKCVLPIIKQARAIQPELFLYASPWSPPAWMKYGDSMLGGSMKPRYLKPYAEYFSKYLQAYAAAGIRLDAVTMQNELGADQDGRMPACVWSEEIEANFISLHLGPMLRQGRTKPGLWMHDHNYDMAGRVMDQLVKEKVRPFVDAVAWHGYAGSVEQMGDVHRAYPEIPMHWTEGGPDLLDPHYETNWAKWSRTFASILHNGCRSISAWNFALDEEGNPNVGPFKCGGLVTINSASHYVTRSGVYWALSHYARAMKRGARLIQSDSTTVDVAHSAAVNPDGSIVVVLTNSGTSARNVRLACGDQATLVNLPGDAVMTLKWVL